jgi:DNA polymerase III delta prime subunit
MFLNSKESLHHAYIIEINRVKAGPLYESIGNRLGVQKNDQDFFIVENSMFGVEDANRVVEINSRKAFGKGNKVIVLSADTFSHQAQNALLKTLEEPTSGTYFFILTSTASTFLPTILSRVQVVKMSEQKGEGCVDSDGQIISTAWSECELPNVTDFLKASIAKRLSFVKEIIKQKENEKIGDGDIFNFIQQLEHFAFNEVQGKKTQGKDEEIQIAKIFSKVGDYMRDTSSSKKMLLEYIALKLPSMG